MAFRDKLRANVQPFLEPGEQVLQVFPANSGMNPTGAAMFGMLGVLLFTKPKIVAVTDRGIVLLAASRWSPSKPVAVEARGPHVYLGPVKGVYAQIHLGERLYVHRRFHQDVRDADAALGAAPPA